MTWRASASSRSSTATASSASEVPPTGIAVVGAGYVGLTTAACMAHLGNRVICADVDARKGAGTSATPAPP